MAASVAAEESAPKFYHDVEKGAKPEAVHLAVDDAPSSATTYDLTVADLTYKVLKKADGRTEEKALLSGVNARARHGEITAIVGPSGAGKSTLLDAVAGRIVASSLQGEILVNGKPLEVGFKRLSGYVMQDDQLFPMLTVRETLTFSARLRLPGSMRMAEKRERVEMLIKELGLTSCADTVIGNEQVRGVSGGERRRVSIGVDLIHDPAVLFLDEPTSGLDSTAALNVMETLSAMARQRGRTVLLTIHQPSFRIIELIDSFVVLARGQSVFNGNYKQMMAYFSDFGGEIPEHVNALEYSLDLIEKQQRSDAGLQPLLAFAESYQGGHGAAHKALAQHSSLGALETIQHRDFSNNFVAETATLMSRNIKNIWRNPELFIARIVLMVVTGLILGSTFWRMGFNTVGISNRASFFIFTLTSLIFPSFFALPIFIDERAIYIRETSRGAYRTSSYVLADALVWLPFLFILALVFGAVVYSMVGLAPTAAAFFGFVNTIFLTLAFANSFTICIAALVPNYIVGNTLLTALTAYFMLFSGFFITKNNIPKYWIWFYYLSIFKYPFTALEVNEYANLPNTCWYISPSQPCASSGQVLGQLDMQNETFWAPTLVMVAFYVGYRFFFYLALKLRTTGMRR